METEVVRITYKEEIPLTLKALYLLKVMYNLPNMRIYTSGEYDWMRRDYDVLFCDAKNERRSTRAAFGTLIDVGLVKAADARPDAYFEYNVTDKGLRLRMAVEAIDTSEYDFLMPEDFKKRFNL